MRDLFTSTAAYTAVPSSSSAADDDDDNNLDIDPSSTSSTSFPSSSSPSSSSSSSSPLSLAMSPLEKKKKKKDANSPSTSIDITPIRPVDTEEGLVTDGQYRVYRRRFLGLGMLCLLNIMVSWAWLTYSPVVSLAAEHFNVSESAINWLSTVILFAYVIATPAVIYSLNRWSTKPTLLAACILLLAGTWIRYGGARSHSFAATMLGQILIGFAQPFVLSAPPHYSDAWFTPTGRISATAIASLSNPIGAAIGQLVNPFWATQASDVPAMVLWIAIITTVGVLGWVVVPDRPPTPPCASAAAAHPRLSPGAALTALRTNREWLAITAMFWVYLGAFNALSTVLAQVMVPRGYTLDTAGLTGALLIVVGLIAAAIISPIVDRTHRFALTIRILVPITAATYVAFIWAPRDGALAAPFTVAAVMGAASFSLLPVALEWAAEITYPVPSEWASGIMWAGGQFVGAVMIVVMDAMKGVGGEGERRREGMLWATVMLAAVAVVVAPGVVLVGRRGERGVGRLGVGVRMGVGVGV